MKEKFQLETKLTKTKIKKSVPYKLCKIFSASKGYLNFLTPSTGSGDISAGASIHLVHRYLTESTTKKLLDEFFRISANISLSWTDLLQGNVMKWAFKGESEANVSKRKRSGSGSSVQKSWTSGVANYDWKYLPSTQYLVTNMCSCYNENDFSCCIGWCALRIVLC